VVAYAESHVRKPAARSRVHWWRIPALVAFVGCVAAIDNAWKESAVVSGHGALDAPSSILRPALTLTVGAVALVGVLVLPRLCMLGALLVLTGVSSNIASLAIWKAVPNPLGVHVAGGVLHFCLADTCVWAGSLLFFAAVLWSLWRMSDERFAELVGISPG
jgi:hypothetical protein